MFEKLRIEATLLLALGVAVAALVVAMRGGSPGEPGEALQADSAGSANGAVTSFYPKGSTEVRIVDFAYDPEPVRVKAGTTIAWTNYDSVPHTATASKGDGDWGSGILEQGDQFTYTFTEPGIYAYLCTLHPPSHVTASVPPRAGGVALVAGGGRPMQGTVIVE
jgi:plastocyanin